MQLAYALKPGPTGEAPKTHLEDVCRRGPHIIGPRDLLPQGYHTALCPSISSYPQNTELQGEEENTQTLTSPRDASHKIGVDVLTHGPKDREDGQPRCVTHTPGIVPTPSLTQIFKKHAFKYTYIN